VLQLQMRCFSMGSMNPTCANNRADPDLQPDRVRVKISKGHHWAHVEERVIAACMILYLTRDAPYKILAFTDSTRSDPTPLENVLCADRQTWELHGIYPCGRCTGVSQFLALSTQIIRRWVQTWQYTLGRFNSWVAVDVCPVPFSDFNPYADLYTSSLARQLGETLQSDGLDRILFDDSFDRSRLYFLVLEMLRVSRGWVDKTIQDWDVLYQQWIREVRPSEVFDEADLQATEHAWGIVTAMVQAEGKLLKDLMDRKSEEVKSLRDGVRSSSVLFLLARSTYTLVVTSQLFNATSLREATKGIELNRAVYVFTVITVIYTPISFLAVGFLPSFLPGQINTAILTLENRHSLLSHSSTMRRPTEILAFPEALRPPLSLSRF